ILSDGPRKDSSPIDKKKIAAVRQIISSKQWCGEVVIAEEKTNKGLADSILRGVTKVIKKHGRVIVLEDDIVTSTGFLKYMNDALNLYGNNDNVMSVSAYQYPIKRKLPETFFHSHISSWGWATWERAWSQLETDPKKLLNEVEK